MQIRTMISLAAGGACFFGAQQIWDGLTNWSPSRMSCQQYYAENPAPNGSN